MQMFIYPDALSCQKLLEHLLSLGSCGKPILKAVSLKLAEIITLTFNSQQTNNRPHEKVRSELLQASPWILQFIASAFTFNF